MRKRGQAALIGFLLVLAVVVVIGPIVGTMLGENKEAKDLRPSAERVAAILLSSGVPSSWNAQTVLKPGVMEGQEVSASLLREFSFIEYSRTKMLFGLGDEDYAFVFVDDSGAAVNVAGKNSFGWKADYTPGNGAENWLGSWRVIDAAARDLIKVERGTTLNGKPARLVVYLWSGESLREMERLPECFDGADNDLDGMTDYPWDPGCATFNDESEENPVPPHLLPQCSNTLDDDGDGLIDFPWDPGCESAADNSEADIVSTACSNGLDDDGDGLEDFPYDPGCESASDTDETNPAVLGECNDWKDNDGDSSADFLYSPGCTSSGDPIEYAPEEDPACSDGIDNDGDGWVDFPEDVGCSSASDESEENQRPAGAYCGNGVLEGWEECEAGIACPYLADCFYCLCYNYSAGGPGYKGPAGEVPPDNPEPEEPPGGDPPACSEKTATITNYKGSQDAEGNVVFTEVDLTYQCCATQADCALGGHCYASDQCGTGADGKNCGICGYGGFGFGDDDAAAGNAQGNAAIVQDPQGTDLAFAFLPSVQDASGTLLFSAPIEIVKVGQTIHLEAYSNILMFDTITMTLLTDTGSSPQSVSLTQLAGGQLLSDVRQIEVELSEFGLESEEMIEGVELSISGTMSNAGSEVYLDNIYSTPANN